MKSFPKPLSAKEEKECLQRMQEGDKEARETLIVRNLRLVAYTIRKYAANDKNADDMISIGTIGLIKAIDTFDLNKGIRLATYASRCIDNEILMFLRSDKKLGREVFLYDPIGADKEGNEINLLDIIETYDEDVPERLAKEEDISKLAGFVEECLNAREQVIIRLRYGLDGGEEMTQRELAKQLGISRSYVSRIEKKALRKLRERYEKQN